MLNERQRRQHVKLTKRLGLEPFETFEAQKLSELDREIADLGKARKRAEKKGNLTPKRDRLLERLEARAQKRRDRKRTAGQTTYMKIVALVHLARGSAVAIVGASEEPPRLPDAHARALCSDIRDMANRLDISHAKLTSHRDGDTLPAGAIRLEDHYLTELKKKQKKKEARA